MILFYQWGYKVGKENKQILGYNLLQAEILLGQQKSSLSVAKPLHKQTKLNCCNKEHIRK